jgi:hypothetical protein
VSPVGIVSIALGLLIVISRGFLLLSPAATLQWFEKIIQTESRTRLVGLSTLPIPVLMIWAGGAAETGLAGVLLIFGLFMLASVSWLVFFPGSFKRFCETFLPPDPGSSLMGWRSIGLLGVFIGGVLIYFGWLAL